MTEKTTDKTVEEQPNLLVILCDQMRAMDVGCYGNDVIKTPHIDALAARGLRCQRAVSNNPVCVPARSILMSGQYGRTCTGSRHNHAPYEPINRQRRRLLQPTWPEVMQQAGYRTQLIGKWHIDPAPDLVGFDHWVSPSNKWFAGVRTISCFRRLAVQHGEGVVLESATWHNRPSFCARC